MFKPFFVHVQTFHRKPYNKHTPVGFTAYVSPNNNPRLCNLQVTFCSPKDQFCKKEGRSQAMQAPVEVVNKRDLPMWVARCNDVLYRKAEWTPSNTYYYLLKYVV